MTERISNRVRGPNWLHKLVRFLGLEAYPLPSNDNVWPDNIQREWPDEERPGLVHRIPPEHIYLCPFEVEAAQKKWDAEHSQSNTRAEPQGRNERS